MKVKIILFSILLLIAFSCQRRYEPEYNIVLNEIGLKVSIDIPDKYDSSFISINYSDYSCDNTHSYSFANSAYNTIYLDTIYPFFTDIDTNIAWQFELLEIEEELNRPCAKIDFESLGNKVMQIHGLTSSDEIKKYHVESIENNNWKIIRLFINYQNNKISCREMYAYVYFEGTFFKIRLINSKLGLDELKDESDKLFNNLKIAHINDEVS